MSKLFVYMFRSRNKDNKDVEGFKERCKTILAYEEDEKKVCEQFLNFANNGIEGEITRLYKSVNARDEDKVRKMFLSRMIMEEKSVTDVNRLLASVAQQKENRAESKWLFDFDEKDENLMLDFLSDVRTMSETIPDVYETMNGYAIIVEHGFDTRELLEKYKDYDITLKRDELLLLGWKKKD